MVNSSRGIIFAYRKGTYAERYGVDDWQGAVRAAAQDMRAEIWQATHGG